MLKNHKYHFSDQQMFERLNIFRLIYIVFLDDGYCLSVTTQQEVLSQVLL